MIVESPQALMEEKGVSASNGVHTIRELVPFRVMMGNFTPKAVTLEKGTVIGNIPPGPATLIKGRTISTAELFGIEVPSSSPSSPPMEKIKWAEIGEDSSTTAKVDSPPGTATTAHKYSEEIRGLDVSYQETIRDMLSKYQHLWVGELGEISTAAHCIELIPGALPVRSQPHRQGPEGRQFEKEVDHML